MANCLKINKRPLLLIRYKRVWPWGLLPVVWLIFHTFVPGFSRAATASFLFYGHLINGGDKTEDLQTKTPMGPEWRGHHSKVCKGAHNFALRH